MGMYKVIWLGYEDTEDEFEWIPASELSHTANLVSDFHITYPTKPSPLPLSWLCYCICPLSPCISNRDFPSLISSIFCLLILINPQLPRTFWGFLFKLQTSFHFNSCLFLLTHLIHRKNKFYYVEKNKTTNLTGGRWQSSPLLTFSGAILRPLLFISILLLFALSFWAPSLLHCGLNSLQLGRVPLLALYQIWRDFPTPWYSSTSSRSAFSMVLRIPP